MATQVSSPISFEIKLSQVIAFAFTIIIVIYAASGMLNEFVRWIVEITTPGFEELSRRKGKGWNFATIRLVLFIRSLNMAFYCPQA